MTIETPENQRKHSDEIFTAVSTGSFDDYSHAEVAVMFLYGFDKSYSRCGISHALKRLENFYKDRTTVRKRANIQNHVCYSTEPNLPCCICGDDNGAG